MLRYRSQCVGLGNLTHGKIKSNRHIPLVRLRSRKWRAKIQTLSVGFPDIDSELEIQIGSQDQLQESKFATLLTIDAGCSWKFAGRLQIQINPADIHQMQTFR